ncbi:MAG: tyrosine-type recombinase/integrase [Acidobacteria bacterium]|nr:tyrosine-type recombinase/integrase [Acidobacteriota bacterium]
MRGDGLGTITKVVRCPKCRRVIESRERPTECECGADLSKQPVRYRARLRIAGRRESRVYAREDMATRWLRERRKQKVDVESGAVHEGRAGTKPRVKYAELGPELITWWESGVWRDYTDDTLRGYRNVLRKVLEHWGKLEVARTREADVRAWTATMKGLAPQTRRNRLDVLSMLHQLAFEAGYVPRIPCAVPRPEPRDAKPRTEASEAELGAALEATQDARTRAALLLAGDAGLRRFEIPPLDGADVDLAGRWVYVRRGKGRKERRAPITTDRLHDALKALAPVAGVRVFSAELDTVDKLDDYLQEQLGEFHPGLHRLRHHAATVWVNDPRNPLPKVQRWLGHRNLATTQRYLHVDDEPPPPSGEWPTIDPRGSGPTRRAAHLRSVK